MSRALALLTICLFVTGCFAFDEIDKGMKTLDKGPKAKEKAAPAQAGKPAAGKEGEARNWWASAHSLNEGPAAAEAEAGDPNAPVGCRLGGATRFMRRADCLSQGGRPK